MLSSESISKDDRVYTFYSNYDPNSPLTADMSETRPHTWARQQNRRTVLSELAAKGVLLISDDIHPVDRMGRELPGTTLFIREGVEPRFVDGLQSRLRSDHPGEFRNSLPESSPGMMLYADEVAALVDKLMVENGLAEVVAQL